MAFEPIHSAEVSRPHHEPNGLRREQREEAVRIVEYTPFPRRSLEQPRVGFTRDFSPSGMCLGVDAAEEAGALLRVTMRDVDGSPSRTVVERVVWCSEERDGRFWIGLELVGDCEARAPRPGATSA